MKYAHRSKTIAVVSPPVGSRAAPRKSVRRAGGRQRRAVEEGDAESVECVEDRARVRSGVVLSCRLAVGHSDR